MKNEWAVAFTKRVAFSPVSRSVQA